MSTSSKRPPAYRRQREKGRSDRAYTVINGKKIKLGVYGSPESKAKYAELLAGSNVAPPTPESKGPPTVCELLAAYLPPPIAMI